MLSPMDLKNRKIEVKKRKYYDRDEMDEYLDLIFENYKALYDQNQELNKDIKTLSDGIQYYRSIETTMQKALVLAEKTAKETKDAAQLKAEAMEKDAVQKAEQIIEQAEQEYNTIKERCMSLVQQFNQYKLQLQQVATAQLEMITSDTFDVYAPELESSLQQGENILPTVQQELETPYEDVPEEQTNQLAIEEEQPVSNDLDFMLEKDSYESQKQADVDSLSKTNILPDIKKVRKQTKKKTSREKDIDILTADTIDLGDALNEVRKPKHAKPKNVQDALVLEPVDAIVTNPIELQTGSSSESTSPSKNLEALEEETTSKESPSLDSLLQSINIGGKRNKKKEKGQDDDPFEHYSSLNDDF